MMYLLSVLFLVTGVLGQVSQVADIEDSDLILDYDTMARMASLPFHCIETEYPNKLGQVLLSETELLSPKVLHPIFYGCFDWHSSVHGHWLLARAAATFPDTELAVNVSRVFDIQFQEEKVATELSFFLRKYGDHFERTYGWAWLLKLQLELEKSALLTGSVWAERLRPLSDHIAELYTNFLPRLVYPVRVGEHSNTGFGLAFALDYTRSNLEEYSDLDSLIVKNSTDFYGEDRLCPIHYEPSGSDFLSPCIQEADLMARVLQDDNEFRNWISSFLPQVFDPEFVLEPGVVVDRTDGKLVHLDGLNFSRAWGLYKIASRLGGEEGNRLMSIADTHIRTSIQSVVGSDYAGSHWLASFLVYALEERARTVSILRDQGTTLSG